MTFRNSFSVGNRVEKYKGGYTAFGTVIAVGKTSSGAVRYMVEYDVPMGLLNIHSDNDLRLAPCAPLARVDKVTTTELAFSMDDLNSEIKARDCLVGEVVVNTTVAYDPLTGLSDDVVLDILKTWHKE